MSSLTDEAAWCARSLFEHGLALGTTGNISIFEDGEMLISPSGSCFGKLNAKSFARVSADGEILEGKPSKEWPLHLALYRANASIQSVVHTHSSASVRLSCLEAVEDALPKLFAYTPYLAMKTKGRIGVVPFVAPGSRELFEAFEEAVDKYTTAYLLRNHGVVTAAANPLEAFGLLEEFESAARLLFEIEGAGLGAYRTIAGC